MGMELRNCAWEWWLELPPTPIAKPFRNPNGPMSNGKWRIAHLLPLEKRISDKIRAAFVHWKLLMNSPSPLSEMLMVHCTNIRPKQKTKGGELFSNLGIMQP